MQDPAGDSTTRANGSSPQHPPAETTGPTAAAGGGSGRGRGRPSDIVKTPWQVLELTSEGSGRRHKRKPSKGIDTPPPGPPTCPVSVCQKQFPTWKSVCNHLRSSHPNHNPHLLEATQQLQHHSEPAPQAQGDDGGDQEASGEEGLPTQGFGGLDLNQIMEDIEHSSDAAEKNIGVVESSASAMEKNEMESSAADGEKNGVEYSSAATGEKNIGVVDSSAAAGEIKGLESEEKNEVESTAAKKNDGDRGHKKIIFDLNEPPALEDEDMP